jgi:hypothetical protein
MNMSEHSLRGRSHRLTVLLTWCRASAAGQTWFDEWYGIPLSTTNRVTSAVLNMEYNPTLKVEGLSDSLLSGAS